MTLKAHSDAGDLTKEADQKSYSKPKFLLRSVTVGLEKNIDINGTVAVLEYQAMCTIFLSLFPLSLKHKHDIS